MTADARRDATAAPSPKQWELRAARRQKDRAAPDGGGRNIAQDIIAAGWELVHEEGAGDFTVKQVIGRAGVALQTFYRHFGTKDELLLAMFEESIQEGVQRFVAASSERLPVDRLHHLVTAPFLQTYDETAVRELRWRALERQRLLDTFPDAVEAVFEPYRAALLDAITEVRDAGEGTCDDPDLTATIVMHLVTTLTHAVHGGGLNEDPERVAERTWQLCWDGLRRDRDATPRRRRARR